MKDESNTHLSRVNYWHVASFGIILSKAGDNKGADMCTFLFAYVISRVSYDMAQTNKVAKIRLYGKEMFQKCQTN